MRRGPWVLGLILSAALGGGAHAATYVVRPDGSGDYPTIQSAVTAALPGDLILLADGTFTGEGNRDVDFLGKAITVCSQSGDPSSCMLDCQGTEAEPHRGFLFVNGEESGSILRDLWIANGWGEMDVHDRSEAGAVLCAASSPTIEHCIFTGNTAWYGGALRLIGGASPRIVDCTFSGNTADDGAGICCWESDACHILRCVFEGNNASHSGGGVSCHVTSTPVVENCWFAENYGFYRAGGLLTDDDAEALITRCTFVGNLALNGGAVYCCGHSIGRFDRCTMTDNDANNGASAVATGCSGQALLTSCLISFGLSGEPVTSWGSGVATLTCCNVFGNAGGDWVGVIAGQAGIEGNFSLDPLYCDRPAEDLTLDFESPCLPGRHPDGWSCGLIGAWPVGCPLAANEDEGGSTPGGPVVLPPGDPGPRLALRSVNPFLPGGRIGFAILLADQGGSLPGVDAPMAATEIAGSTERLLIGIYDLTGRQVRHLYRGSAAAGWQAVEWRGIDDAGHPLPAGTYICRLVWGRQALSRRLSLVR